jgi:hypothetical protein
MGYKLTPKGEVYALHITPNTPENAVLVYLYEHGRTGESIEIDELVGELRSTENTVLRIVSRLLNAEHPYVKEV